MNKESNNYTLLSEKSRTHLRPGEHHSHLPGSIKSILVKTPIVRSPSGSTSRASFSESEFAMSLAGRREEGEGGRAS